MLLCKFEFAQHFHIHSYITCVTNIIVLNKDACFLYQSLPLLFYNVTANSWYRASVCLHIITIISISFQVCLPGVFPLYAVTVLTTNALTERHRHTVRKNDKWPFLATLPVLEKTKLTSKPKSRSLWMQYAWDWGIRWRL